MGLTVERLMVQDVEDWVRLSVAEATTRYAKSHDLLLGSEEDAAFRERVQDQFRALAPLMTELWDLGFDISEPYELRTNRFYRLPNNARRVLPVLIRHLPTTRNELAQKELVSTIWHLGGTGQYEAMTEDLIEVLMGEGSHAVQEELANCIAAFAKESNLEMILNALNNPFGPRDWGLAAALGRMPATRVEEKLRSLLDDDIANNAAQQFKGSGAAKLAAEFAPSHEVELRRAVLGEVSKSALVDLAIPVATKGHVYGQGGALVAVRDLKLVSLSGAVSSFADHPMSRVKSEARKTIKSLQ